MSALVVMATLVMPTARVLVGSTAVVMGVVEVEVVREDGEGAVLPTSDRAGMN